MRRRLTYWFASAAVCRNYDQLCLDMPKILANLDALGRVTAQARR